MSEYAKKAQFFGCDVAEGAPSSAATLLAEGTAFKQLARIAPSKLQAEDTSGMEAIGCSGRNVGSNPVGIEV